MTHPVARAGAEALAVVRGATPTHRHLRERLVAVVAISLVLDLVCAVIALLIERHGAGTEVRTFGSALFWTTTQMLTVSSQMKNPVTTAGRVLDVCMEIYAITVVTTIGGMFAAFFHHRSTERRRAAQD